MDAGVPWILALDCGATNIRAGAVTPEGRILHIAQQPNAAVTQQPGRDWLIWDTEAIWEKLLACAGAAVAAVGRGGCRAIVVTTFSDDGAPVDGEGRLLYPVISWQCQRTSEMSRELREHITVKRLYRITGEQLLPQHSLFRLLWLRDHAPGILERASRYLMFPHIMNFRLTGRMVNDPTTADSMMLLDLRRRTYSPRLLERFQLDPGLFPDLLEPGEIIGPLLPAVAGSMGLGPGIPVVAGGHDTQFAVLGSGCVKGGAVLSSGTWEILFTRQERCKPSEGARSAGIKYECDAERGLWDVGAQWIGSGALEWLCALLYPHIEDREARYAAAQEEARGPSHGAVTIVPDLVSGTVRDGPSASRGGSILGCTLTTTRADLYRALLQSLCDKTRVALRRLEQLTGTRFEKLIVVGGGTRNRLWNQLRADTLGLPLHLTSQVENTMVGAAMVGAVGCGIFPSLDEAGRAVDFKGAIVEPRATSC